jgi:hypothetical protein
MSDVHLLWLSLIVVLLVVAIGMAAVSSLSGPPRR